MQRSEVGFYRKTGNEFISHGKSGQDTSRITSSAGDSIDYSSDSDGGITFEEAKQISQNAQNSYLNVYRGEDSSGKKQLFNNYITRAELESDSLSRSTNPLDAYPDTG